MKKSTTVILAAGLLLLAQAAYAGPGKKGSFGFSLSGEMRLINGGDLNGMVRDWNKLMADPDMADYSPKIDWQEIKTVPMFGAEIFYHVSSRFAVSFGVEYMKKKNSGLASLGWSDEYEYEDVDGYYLITEDYTSDYSPDVTVSAVPLTLNAYYYLPVGKWGQAFAKAGIGYYLAKMESVYTIKQNFSYEDEYYYLGSLVSTYIAEDDSNSVISNSAKGNALGFHVGLGFELNMSSALALVVEAGFRQADLKNWDGEATLNYTYSEQYGYLPDELYTYTDSGSESYSGRLIFMEDALYDGDSLVLVENPDWDYLDSRPAVIKLGGPSLKIGVKIRL